MSFLTSSQTCSPSPNRSIYQGLPTLTLPGDFLGGGGLDLLLGLRRRLTSLDLSHNAIAVTDVGVLADALGDHDPRGGPAAVSALRHLNLSHNRLARLCGGGPGSAFPLSMGNLETLDASHNAITVGAPPPPVIPSAAGAHLAILAIRRRDWGIC